MFHVDTDTGLLFDVLLHVGTLIAVCVVYYKDILRMAAELICIIADCIHNIRAWIGRRRGRHIRYRRIIHNSYRKFVLMILVSTVPTGVIGYVGRDFVEAASEILLIPGICLIITAVLLFVSDFAGDGGEKAQAGPHLPMRLWWVSVRESPRFRDFPLRHHHYGLCAQRF